MEATLDRAPHAVQFYATEAALLATVTPFLADGLQQGQPGLVVATPAHRAGLEASLATNGVDVAAARAHGQYCELDAAETLARFMTTGMPDPARFEAVVGGIITRLSGGGRVHIFGEMVALLATEGNHAAALRLEALWSALQARLGFSLLCAYPLHAVTNTAGAAHLGPVGVSHSRILTAAGVPDVSAAAGGSAEPGEALRTLLATIVETSNDAILTKTLDGIITSWNRAAERLYGYTAAEAIGQPVSFHMPSGQEDDFPAILGRLRRGERVEQYETVRQHKDGHRLDISITVSPLVAADGTIIGASAIARDISERKQLEAERLRQDAALRASEDKYRSLFRSINQGFCLLEVLWDDAGQPSDLRYLDVNPAFAQQTGLHDAAGKTARELYGGIEEGWLQTVAGVARTGEPARQQDYVAALGRWFDVYFFRLAELHDHRVGAIFTDITERLRREAEREAFVAALTHDLKSPLTTVQGMAQLLLRRAQRGEPVTPDQLRASLAPIQAATGRMVTMLNELLDVARIQQGRALDLQLGDCDLVALSQEVVAEQQTLSTRHTLQLYTSEPTLVGRWDCSRLERVLRNLLTNAVKYSPEGGEVRVALGRDAEATHAVLSVADQGLGIPAAELPHLFHAFRRGSNVTEQIPGSGIGLVSVQQVVVQHGGTVAVTSVEGQGSTFTVRLPFR